MIARKKAACKNGYIGYMCINTKLMLRATYMASKCDFVLEQENWDSHAGAINETINAQKNA